MATALCDKLASIITAHRSDEFCNTDVAEKMGVVSVVGNNCAVCDNTPQGLSTLSESTNRVNDNVLIFGSIEKENSNSMNKCTIVPDSNHQSKIQHGDGKSVKMSLKSPAKLIDDNVVKDSALSAAKIDVCMSAALIQTEQEKESAQISNCHAAKSNMFNFHGTPDVELSTCGTSIASKDATVQNVGQRNWHISKRPVRSLRSIHINSDKQSTDVAESLVAGGKKRASLDVSNGSAFRTSCTKRSRRSCPEFIEPGSSSLKLPDILASGSPKSIGTSESDSMYFLSNSDQVIALSEPKQDSDVITPICAVNEAEGTSIAKNAVISDVAHALSGNSSKPGRRSLREAIVGSELSKSVSESVTSSNGQTTTATRISKNMNLKSPFLSPQISLDETRHGQTKIKRNAKGETQLHSAVIKGDLVKVQRLLAEGDNPNVKDYASWTPLHEACNHGYTSIAELLINHGSNINEPGSENATPLHDAVQNNRLNCVRLLVSRGASLTVRDDHGHTAVDLAESQDMKDALAVPVIKIAAQEARNCQTTIVSKKSELSSMPTLHITEVLPFIECSVSSPVSILNVKTPVAIRGCKKFTTPRSTLSPHTPINESHCNENKTINIAKAETRLSSVASKEKTTPIRWNSRENIPSSIAPLSTPYCTTSATPKLLKNPTTPANILSPQAPIDGTNRSQSKTRRNAKGETRLHTAVIKGDQALVKKLLEDGASPNVKDYANWTPLHEACNHGYVEIAKLLLNHNAFINTPGNENATPLHDAVQNYRLDCVRLLVSRGASTTMRDLYGKTVFDLAVTQEMKDALKVPIVETSECVTKEAACSALVLNHTLPVILATGLTRAEKAEVKNFVHELHWKMVDIFSSNVSHVITSVNEDGSCPRTIKYLKAVLTGKWIVNFDWIETCHDFKCRVPEDSFEVPGSTRSPQSRAPYKGRQNIIMQLPGLFDGCHFYFAEDSAVPVLSEQELSELVRMGSASILTHEPKQEAITELTVPFHADPSSSLADCSYFIVSNNNERDSDVTFVSKRLCRVSESWILDCISEFKLLSNTDIKNNSSR